MANSNDRQLKSINFKNNCSTFQSNNFVLDTRTKLKDDVCNENGENKHNKNITNNKIIGVIHNDTNYVNYINISETINTITELKELKINKYDIISINSSCCNENVIHYINSTN